MNTQNQNEVGRWVRGLIQSNNIHAFYVSSYWQRLRREILNEQNNECQRCKAKGYYTKANHVHHVQYVRRHPQLALSKTYVWQGEERQNLIALCHDCHEAVHGHRQKKKRKPLTEERWD